MVKSAKSSEADQKVKHKPLAKIRQKRAKVAEPGKNSEAGENRKHEHDQNHDSKPRFSFRLSFESKNSSMLFRVTPDRLEFREENLIKDLIREAKAIGLPVGMAEDIAKSITKEVVEWVQENPREDEEALNSCIAGKATKYNKDLAYVYQNRGKII